jgi:EAL domain-containing protein (putative c-di-GMP-specific phosphodiesterase class I)
VFTQQSKKWYKTGDTGTRGVRVVRGALQRVVQRAAVAAGAGALAVSLARSGATEELWRSVPTSSGADELVWALAAVAPIALVAAILPRTPERLRQRVRFLHRARRAEPSASEVRAQQVQRLLKAASTLEMHFQPIVDLRDGAVHGYEALARFHTDEELTPDVWFAQAAEVGMGIELELFAIRHVLRQLGDLPPEAYVAVNVSPAAVVSADFQSCFQGSPAGRIVVELTEHAEVADYDRLRTATGVRVAVDDAGSGFSSFRHILRLGPDIIKLDRELVCGLQEDPARRALCGSLVQFANEVGATIVAEGIEERDELDALLAAGVSHGQGFLLGRPEPCAAAAA